MLIAIQKTSFFVFFVLHGLMFQPFVLGQDSLCGKWNASLDTGHGELPFVLVIEEEEQKLQAEIHNGTEVIPVDISVHNDQAILEFRHYDSRIEFKTKRAEENSEANLLIGKWKKTRGDQNVAVMPFKAEKFSNREGDDPKDFIGKFEVQFDGDEQLAVAEFKKDKSNERVLGTFLTTTGDYRYLAGQVESGELTLSCFDGAHAFLFKAKLARDSDSLPGSIEGMFYSGNWYSQKWTAKPNSEAHLPDASTLTKAVEGIDLGDLTFPNLDGEKTSIRSLMGNGKVTIVELFGTWCPNCHDAAKFLAELKSKYGDDLEVVGLAFEITGDFDRNRKQVEEYIRLYDVPYTILIAGSADKAEATKQFQFLDRVRSYPTFIFVDDEGIPQKIYQGFSGPATGEAHQELQNFFEDTINQIIN